MPETHLHQLLVQEIKLIRKVGLHRVRDHLDELPALAELDAIIESENLRPDETRVFVETAFRDGSIQTTGTSITKVLPPASRFSAKGGHSEKKHRVLEKLGAFFERFFGLSSGGSN